MKKLSKLLALLLALVMVFSLAACGADGEDKENTEDTGSAVVDNNDEKKEPSAEEMIAGEWHSRFDLSDAMNLMMAASLGDVSLIPNTEVYMDLTFKFADEKFVMVMEVDKESIEAYMADLADKMIDYMYAAYEAQGVTKDVLDAQIEDAYGLTMEEYVNAMMEESLDGALDEMNNESEPVYYRVDAENGATLGKFELAKRAKELGLDAIHDTVHEMARDEARHGKAFEGLLKRYFNK